MAQTSSRLVILSQLVRSFKGLQTPKPARPRPRPSDFVAKARGAVVHEERLPESIRTLLVHHRRSEAAYRRSNRPTLRSAIAR